MKASKRIRITHIHKNDAYYGRREGIIGLKGEFNSDNSPEVRYPGYYSGDFIADKSKRYLFFIGVRYRRI